jgi:hypothetical protein
MGLSSAPIALGQSWQWADSPSTNLPTAYLFSGGSYQLQVVGPRFPPTILYNLIVEGNPVPEPVSQVFVTTGLLAWLALRRRRLNRNTAKADGIGTDFTAQNQQRLDRSWSGAHRPTGRMSTPVSYDERCTRICQFVPDYRGKDHVAKQGRENINEK